jgi:peptidoglycan/LPS O-acetylase OafA/YrhL
MRYLAGIFALLTGASGWYYLFYSRAAHRLAGIEDQRLNERRVGLRRVGGVAMLLLAALFFTGVYALDEEGWSPFTVMFVWLAVLVLLIAVVVLAMIDLRLTRKLRSRTSRDKGLHS